MERPPPLGPRSLDAYQRGVRRRWVILGFATTFLVMGRLGGFAPASLLAIAFTAGGAAMAIVTFGVAYRRWHDVLDVPALAIFDALLVGIFGALYSPTGLSVLMLAVILPYVVNDSRPVGPVAAVGATAVYLAVAVLHRLAFFPPASLGLAQLVEAAFLLAAGLFVTRDLHGAARRLMLFRSAVESTSASRAGVDMPDGPVDEAGALGRVLRGFLTETRAALDALRHDAAAVARSAGALAAVSDRMRDRSEQVAETAATLASGIGKQRAAAEGGRQTSARAATDADDLRHQAEEIEGETRRLRDVAERGRERATRASDALGAIGEEIRNTMAAVKDLSDLSERIVAFAQSIGRIARQTHLLALNAAIEAARAEEHGAGFAAVAHEVRGLAGEASRSARDVTEVIAEVRAGIEAVAAAMGAGAEQVQSVGEVAGDARRSLDAIHTGAADATERVTVAIRLAREQVARLGALATDLARSAEISAHASTDADGAVVGAESQAQAIVELTQRAIAVAEAATRLLAAADRLAGNGAGPDFAPTAPGH
jgi:methyl-accepting chemotaxis protein